MNDASQETPSYHRTTPLVKGRLINHLCRLTNHPFRLTNHPCRSKGFYTY